VKGHLDWRKVGSEWRLTTVPQMIANSQADYRMCNSLHLPPRTPNTIYWNSLLPTPSFTPFYPKPFSSTPPQFPSRQSLINCSWRWFVSALCLTLST